MLRVITGIGVFLLLLVFVGMVALGEEGVLIYYSFDSIEELDVQGFGIVPVIPDKSGNEHHGVIMSITEDDQQGLTLIEGIRGMAGLFERGTFLWVGGESEHGEQFPEDEIPKEEITVMAWVKLPKTGDHHEIFNARASDGNWLFHPEIRNEGKYRWLVRTSWLRSVVTILDIYAGQVEWDKWIHFTGVYSSIEGYGAIYINGEEIERENTSNLAMIQDWGLGARVGLTIDDARPFTGLMDELIIWKRALTQEEIKTIMEEGI